MESMTGFGSAVAEGAGLRITAEARSVNSKGLDIHLKLPSFLARHELCCREAVRARARRGRVDVFVAIEFTSPQAVKVSVSESVVRAASEAASKLRLENLLDRGLTWSDLESLPGAVSAGLGAEAEEGAGALTRQVLEKAVDALVKTRLDEGERLKGQFEEARNIIIATLLKVRELMPRQRTSERQRLGERLAELGVAVDSSRIEQEIVLAAQKSDISEEVVRLEAHMQALGDLLNQGQSELGRRLDHLVQEIQRETSTLLAKSSLLELTRLGMDIRLETEKMKEQAQNVA